LAVVSTSLEIKCIHQFVLLLKLDVVLLEHQVDGRHARILDHVESVNTRNQTLSTSSHDELGHISKQSKECSLFALCHCLDYKLLVFGEEKEASTLASATVLLVLV
jgi:hypothetical protein